MIAFLRGILATKDSAGVIIDVGGVGYALSMSQGSLAKLPATGEEVSLLTYMQVREDAIALYGFSTAEEKALFERLISVSGVGPKVALAALSSFSPQALAGAIAASDVALVSKIPGVGKKTASRIILELKGSFDEYESSLFSGSEGTSLAQDASARAVLEDLLAMGFSSAEAELALRGAPADFDEKKLLKFALKKLGSA